MLPPYALPILLPTHSPGLFIPSVFPSIFIPHFSFFFPLTPILSRHSPLVHRAPLPHLSNAALNEGGERQLPGSTMSTAVHSTTVNC